MFMTPKKLTLAILVLLIIVTGGFLAWPKDHKEPLPNGVYYNSQGYYQKKGDALPYDPETHTSAPYSLDVAREKAKEYRE